MREIARVPNVVDPADRTIRVLTISLEFAVQGQEIYAWGHTPDLEIRVYDAGGDQLRVLSPSYARIPVTDQVKSLVIDSYRAHPAFAGDIEEISERLVFPDYLPAIWQRFVDERRVSVLTYWRAGEDGELLLMDPDGGIKRRVRLPIPLSPSHTPYPATVHKDSWYQRIRDAGDGTWQLHVEPLR